MGPKPLQLVSLEEGTVDTDGHRENTMGDASSAAKSQGTARSWEGGWDLPSSFRGIVALAMPASRTCSLQDPRR